MMQRSPEFYEVLILGAGPAGCATALGLLAAGVERVLLVDKPLAWPFRIGESATPDVAVLLAELGLEKRLEHLGHLPYHGNLSCWGSEEAVAEHFLLRGKGHGWHLDRAAFDAWLRQEAVARGAQLLSPCAIEALAPTAEGWQIALQGKGMVTADVLVDAAGRRAPLAARLGVRRCTLDGLQAIAAQTLSTGGMGGLSLVESFPDGWWYAAELPDGRAMVALMTDADIAKERAYNQPEGFWQALRDTKLLARHLAAPAEPIPLGSFAAHSGFLEHAAGKRWIAVGDALMGLDPLTSSGISGALNDAVAAVPVILEQLDGRYDLAKAYAGRADATFKRYWAERRRHYGDERRWQEQTFWARRQG